MKIVDEYLLDFVGDAEVGLEIELEGRRLVPERSIIGWVPTRDNSLRGQPEAIEYVLESPIRRAEVPRLLKVLQARLKGNNATIAQSDRCGVHVHINCQELTTEQVITYALLYFIFEDLIVHHCGDDREGNLFCLRASDADAVIDALLLAKEENSLAPLQSNEYRYAALNFASIKKYGSLEFRPFPTPADLSQIATWVDILLKIKDASLQYDNTIQIVQDLSMIGEEQFLQRVMQEHTPLLTFPNTTELMMQGARRIQDVAYTEPRKKEKRLTGSRPPPVRRGRAPQPAHRLEDDIPDVPLPEPRPIRMVRTTTNTTTTTNPNGLNDHPYMPIGEWYNNLRLEEVVGGGDGEATAPQPTPPQPTAPQPERPRTNRIPTDRGQIAIYRVPNIDDVGAIRRRED